MDFIWILVAYLCGLSLKMIGMPPLIGFLLAGFLLHFFGVEPSDSLDSLADIGITLMLFTIGLKLHLGDLLRSEVWVSTLSHITLWIIVFGSFALLMASFAMPYYSDIDLSTAALIGFALSFSSTVCIVKLLEENGEMKTRHGQLAIGVLVMQDIVAVLFLVVATGKLPSVWAPILLALVFARPLLFKLLDKAGHGEMLPLTGFFFALGGYELFNLLGVKGDLGALVLGLLLSQHAKASELTKSLLSFKDLFLIGFFLSIGFTALPTWSMLASAGVIALLISIKFILFFALFTRLKLRSRTAYLASLALSNFSEFGLIVAALSVDAGWLSREWLVILALAVSLSFILTSILYPAAHRVYMRYKDHLKRYESPQRLGADIIQQPPNAEVLVIGMGRVGKSAFKALQSVLDDRVAGIDSDRFRASQLQAKGLNVCFGDGEDADFWETFDCSDIKLVLLALPLIEDSRNVSAQLINVGYTGQIAAIARYEDDRKALIAAGIDKVFNFYKEAGSGFAEDSLHLISKGHHDTKPARSID
ncbi:cation:proton antiporter [Amphritea sp. 1_MG-2023]|uniref:cation:proton antiporter family protein n=1 Tax=Amphritea sp. 1_MG-2023 TaxID=3062670 RepID=UPI0026E376EF|nr:cation:proton antiporter family protein [Amphritea sp. 1_MG-2023]MDO6563453.1 cation:proton antiporter [Amphritea sp. 1_MG-2023]